MNDYPTNSAQSQAHAHAADATFSGVSNAETSKVLRNTYTLLGATLLFSAIIAGAGMAFGMPRIGLWALLPYVGLLVMVEKNKNKASGIAWVFALTGWLGLTLAPMLSSFIAVGLSSLIMVSLAGTAGIFFVMSGYVLITRKNLSFMTMFLMTGLTVAFFAAIGAYIFGMSGVALAAACMFMFISPLLMAWQTSEIIHGGETNYISATVGLYVAIYNTFSSLLYILGVTSD